MPDLPVQPRLTRYRGGKQNLQRKAADANTVAHRIAAHVNKLIANNPNEVQQIMFASVALDLGVPTDAVRRALPGGYNGWTFRVDADDRVRLERYRGGEAR